jgi:4-hydroxy-tetrahydrodipicolinate synthase
VLKLDANFLRGSYPPVITPFKNGAVDYDTYARLVEMQVTNGSHGVVVTGTSGEPSMLTVDERAELLKTALSVAKGKIPVVAATGSQSYAESLELSQRAAKLGADALLVVTPYYSQPPQRGLVEYFVAIGRAVELPLLIYHIPGRASVSVTLETLEAISEKLPTLVGIKHAVNDLNFVTKMIERFGPDFRVFAGLESLSFPILAIGGAGLMNAVSNLWPARVAELCNLTFAGDLEGAKRLHYELFELNEAVFYDTNPIAVKYMMKRLGLLEKNEHRLPMVSATPELERRLDGVLERCGLLKKELTKA